MHTDDIKVFAIDEKELETRIQAVRTYSQDIGKDIKKCAMLIMKSGKRRMTEGKELPNKEKSEPSEKRKLTNAQEYWKRTPSNMRR